MPVASGFDAGRKDVTGYPVIRTTIFLSCLAVGYARGDVVGVKAEVHAIATLWGTSVPEPLPKPEPPVWPEQLHAVLLQNRTNRLAIVDLWYDWPNGRNFNIIRSQLGKTGTLYDLEWNNGTSYYYDLDAGTCRRVKFGVGILAPNWLAGAEFLGTDTVDSVETNVWTKADGFITYFADVNTGLPVRWTFFDDATFHVMKWEAGAALSDAEWQAPSYCFTTDSLQHGQVNLGHPVWGGLLTGKLQAPKSWQRA